MGRTLECPGWGNVQMIAFEMFEVLGVMSCGSGSVLTVGVISGHPAGLLTCPLPIFKGL